jgi:hypothetical protein
MRLQPDHEPRETIGDLARLLEGLHEVLSKQLLTLVSRGSFLTVLRILVLRKFPTEKRSFAQPL